MICSLLYCFNALNRCLLIYLSLEGVENEEFHCCFFIVLFFLWLAGVCN